MVLEIPKSEWITLRYRPIAFYYEFSLCSHKERRGLINKEKRRRLRQKIAQERSDAEKGKILKIFLFIFVIEFEKLKLEPEYM